MSLSTDQPATDRLADATPAGAESANQPHAGRKGYLTLDNRFLPPILITCILLGAQVTFGMLESWTQTGLAIGTAVALELVLARFMLGKWPHLASAYISGISVGILIRSPFLWPYAMCSALSIMSKYVLRWENRHLWNPSNFGVSAMLFLYPAVVAPLSIQWGNSMWAMAVIWVIGSITIMRVRRFHICVSYVTGFLLFSFLRSQITGNPFVASIAPLTGPMYQLFVFFMITDPRTTVSSYRGQIVVAFLVAAVEMVLRLAEFVHAPFYALFLVGPPALAIEIARSRRSASREPEKGKDDQPAVETATAASK